MPSMTPRRRTSSARREGSRYAVCWSPQARRPSAFSVALAHLSEQYYEVALTPAFEASFCHATGAIGCVSLVEKRVLNAGSDGGNQCSGANSSHFLPPLPSLDRRRRLRHPRFTASV